MASDLVRPAEPKIWHSSVTDELRAHILYKIVQAIFPLPMSELDHTDQRLQILTDYAKQIESDLFAMAETRSEYYHLVAEKVYKIMREMEEKRQKKKEQSLPATSAPNASNTQEAKESKINFPEQELRWKRLQEKMSALDVASESELDDMIKEFQKDCSLEYRAV